ncbi:TetR/AcrR family transcriptional regulator [Streptomyces sp. NPDC002596]
MTTSQETQRRPRGSLSRQSIGAAALRVIERDGLESLTMRRVAGELSCGVMSLYSHVTDADDLRGVVVGQLIDRLDLRAHEGESWQDATRRMLSTYADLAASFPRSFELLALADADQRPVAPHMERLVDLLVTAGLTEEDALTALSVIDAYASGFLVIAVRNRPTVASAERAAPHRHDQLARLHHLDSYGTGSEVIIAGLEQRFEGRRARRKPR